MFPYTAQRRPLVRAENKIPVPSQSETVVAREFHLKNPTPPGAAHAWQEIFLEEPNPNRETEHLCLRQPIHGIGRDPFALPASSCSGTPSFVWPPGYQRERERERDLHHMKCPSRQKFNANGPPVVQFLANRKSCASSLCVLVGKPNGNKAVCLFLSLFLSANSRYRGTVSETPNIGGWVPSAV